MGSFVVLVEDASGAIAWKPRVEASEGAGYSFVDTGGPGWVSLFECGEAFAEAGCVLVGDGKDSDAALRAAGVADQVMPAAAVSVGYGGVYDLDERLRHDDSVERSRFVRCPYFKIEMGASGR